MVFSRLFSKARISVFFSAIGAAMLALALLLCALTYALFVVYTERATITKEKAGIETLTRELRQSSDDLTRFARLYALTGDEKYADNYRKVIGIRDGVLPRPPRYDQIYWDLSPGARRALLWPGRQEALADRLDALPLLDSERALLQKSHDRSDALTAMEFNVFDTVREADEEKHRRARDMLFSEQYQARKSEVMLPLHELLLTLESRYAGRDASISRRIDGFFAAFTTTLLLCLFLALLTLIFVRKKVMAPMRHLLENIRDIRRDRPPLRRIFYSDEFGELMRQFYSMKEQMDRSYHDLEMVSFTDALTGLYNRHYFFQMAKQQVQIAARNGHPVSVIICDADHFKSVNDNYGHLVGDEVLKHVAALVRSSVRESDACARFGGEEFVVLLNNSNIDNSAEIGEKIRAALENTPFKRGEIELRMTISIGVAAVRDFRDGNINEAIDDADKALYEAKNAGRNRVRRA